MQNPLNTPIEYLKGVGPERGQLLREELKIKTYEDLANHFPFRYVDRSKFYIIKELNGAMAEVQIVGKITNIQEVKQQRGKRIVATFQDASGSMELVWFKCSQWLKDKLQQQMHMPLVIYGKPNVYNQNVSIVHPEIETIDKAKTTPIGLYPVYPSTEKLAKKGITNRVLQQIQQELLKLRIFWEENLSSEILNKYQLISRSEAYFKIHYPKNLIELQSAEKRFKFEDFFFLHLGMQLKKLETQKTFKSVPFTIVGKYFNDFYNNHLPFELTNAQKRVIKEIRHDLGREQQMNRMLQGDVGSGKTMVAFMAMLIAIDNGFQSTMIAPTEILAQQHYNGLLEYINNGLEVNIGLLTGSTKQKDRKKLLEALAKGELHILIGTHAILEDPVVFANLGLSIIDEQHRFGVAQRAKLWKKSKIPPHILVMTATPIPRTLAMSLYGDLDVSVIDEMPKGRKPIQTIHKRDKDRLAMFHFLKQEIAKGRQVYFVYPLIEESKKLELKDLTDGFESISREFPLPKFAVGMVHGKMKNEEKDYEMRRFIKGETNILVATTVIEVGVNVPNASVMVIENAERFGLSQLHQLRGRVGRGSEQSYCILMTKDDLNETAFKRISTMCQSTDGFEIAEVDLQLRGPGDLMGTQQSGVLDFKIANLTKDKNTLQVSRFAVEELLKDDPILRKPENLGILNYLWKTHKDKMIWSRIS